MKIKAITDFQHIDKMIKKGEEITVSKKYGNIYWRLGYATEVKETNNSKTTTKNK